MLGPGVGAVGEQRPWLNVVERRGVNACSGQQLVVRWNRGCDGQQQRGVVTTHPSSGEVPSLLSRLKLLGVMGGFLSPLF